MKDLLKHLVNLRFFSSPRPSLLILHPVTQKSRLQYRFFHPKCLLEILNVHVSYFSLRSPAIIDTENSGGFDIIKWTWSSWTDIFRISSFLQVDSCSNIPSTTLGKRLSLQNWD